MTTKINNLIKKFVCFVFLANTGMLQAQQNENPEGSVTPGAANYQNVNVDLFRGRHNISIPIYNFKSKSLSVPISLDYTPVDILSQGTSYNPGIVGAGWSLTAGGVITRSQYGVVDETPGIGNFNNNNTSFDPIFNSSDAAKYECGEDEFTFNFCGYSGTFFYYRGTWKIFSNVDFEIRTTYADVNGVSVLSGFIIDAPDGVTYTFGGSNAVEYSTFFSGILSPISTSWFLTRIESSEMEAIDFNYDNLSSSYKIPITKQSKISSKITGSIINQGDFSSISTSPTDAEITNLSVCYKINPVYLSSISSSTVSIHFNKSISNGKIPYGSTTGNNCYKLDNIELSCGYLFKRFNLTYIENSDEILKLQSIKESAISLQGSIASLPAYQFGYLSNTDEVAPEVLSKITYPTGGYSSFLFEKNGFSMSSFGSGNEQGFDGKITVMSSPNLSPWMSDGFRIKKKISKSSETDKADITDFYYCDEFPQLDPALASQNNSTGIQNRMICLERTDVAEKASKSGYIYTMKKVTGFDCINPDELPNSTIRNPMMGYSSVWVVQSKEGDTSLKSLLEYKNYKFTNYITFIQDVNGNYIYTHNNLNEVGKIQSFYLFNSQKIEISSTKYEYGNSQESKISRFYTKLVTFRDQYNYIRTEADPKSFSTKYSRNNMVKKTTLENGGFETTTTYSYDDNTNNLKEVKVVEPVYNYKISDYATTTTSYRYITDFDIGYNQYKYHTVKNIPVEKVIKKNGKVIAAEFTSYKNIGGNYIKRPDKFYSLEISNPITDYMPPTVNWDKGDSRYKLKRTFDLYDSSGNLLQYHDEGCAPVSFYYNGSLFPVLEMKNCTYSAFEAVYPDSRLRKLLSNAQITEYIYDPRFGLTSVTTPNGVTTTKEYDVFGRLKCIKDNNGKILKTIDYSYQIQ